MTNRLVTDHPTEGDAIKGKGTLPAIGSIFERVHAHLFAQQCRPEDVDGEPYYRGLDNRRCGVGILIDSAFYCSAIEYLGVSLLRVSGEDLLVCALRRSGVNVDDDQVVGLLIDLQDIHDLTAIGSWPAALEDTDQRLSRQLSCQLSVTPLAA